MKKKQTPSTIIEQIRVNSNVAYEANSISERLEQFWYNMPEYVEQETNDRIQLLRKELDEIVRIEYKANEELMNEFKQLSK